MGYRVVRSDDVDPADDRPCTMRRLADPAGLDRMAVNRFTADPGEQIPLAYHYHDEQEEAFYVLSGRLHVETPEKTYELGPNDFFGVDPGSPQRAYNPADADESVDVVAIGAPPVSGDANPYDPEEDRS